MGDQVYDDKKKLKQVGVAFVVSAYNCGSP
jgi:hypothetical protein